MPLTLLAPLGTQLESVLELTPQLAGQLANELCAMPEQFSFSELEETAIPSYTHRLAPIRYLFLKRLRAALDLSREHLAPGEVLDFGCGAGLMTVALAQQGFAPTRCDLRPQFCTPIAQGLAPDIEIENFALLSHFKSCVALDVLEHLSEDELRNFSDGFAPGARLILSGPTENILYQMGRRVAGFKGGYHQRDVFQILQFFEQQGWQRKSPVRWVFSRWLCPAFVVVALGKGQG